MAEKTNEKGGSLAPIYDRLSRAGGYHPYSAETFSDWSLESGDVVTLYKEGTAYRSPVYTSRMVWRGSPKTTLSTTGNQEREPVAKLGNRKYAGGGGGYRNSDLIDTRFTQNQEMIMLEAWDRQDQYNQFYSGFQVTAKKISAVVQKANEAGEILKQAGFELTADGFLVYAVDASKPLYITSMLNVMADGIRAEVNAADSQIYSYIDLTASSLRTEIGNSLSGVYSTITQTAEEIKTEVHFSESNIYSFISQTASSIRSEVGNSLSGVYSTITQTAESIMSAVNSADSNIYSFILQTASGIQTEVGNALSGVYSKITQTADEIKSEVYSSNSEIYSYISQTASGIRTEVGNSLSGVYSSITQTADEIRTDVYMADSAIYSFISQTASGIKAEVGNSLSGVYSSITQTAEEIRTDVYRADSAIYSFISQTASGIRTEVGDSLSGVYSSISQTAEEIKTEVHSADSDIYSFISQTASGIRSEVGNSLSGVYSSISQNANKIALVVNDNNTLNQASIIAAINGGGSSVTISADKIDLAGYVTASELAATNANIQNLRTGLDTATAIDSLLITSDKVEATALEAGSFKFGNNQMQIRNITMGNFISHPVMTVQTTGNLSIDHYHDISAQESGGDIVITLGAPRSTEGTANFSIAATQTYKDGVAAAASNVNLSGAWNGNVFTVTLTNGKARSETLTAGTGTGNQTAGSRYTINTFNSSHMAYGYVNASSAPYSRLFTFNVDASSVYAEGAASVTPPTVNVVKGAWSGGQITFSPSSGSGSSKSVGLSLSGDWGTGDSSNKYTYTVYDGSVSTGLTGIITAASQSETAEVEFIGTNITSVTSATNSNMLVTVFLSNNYSTQQSVSLDTHLPYNAGWAAAKDKIIVTDTLIRGPSDTVGEQTTLYEFSNGNVIVSDKAAYNKGWADAVAKIEVSETEVRGPSSTVGVGERIATRYGTTEITDQAAYNNGWKTAAASVTLPPNNTSSSSFTVKCPASNVGSVFSVTYSLTKYTENGIRYAEVRSSGFAKARLEIGDDASTVSLNNPVWGTNISDDYNTFTVEASNGASKSQGVYLTHSTWNTTSGFSYVYMRTGSYSGNQRARIRIDIPSGYTKGTFTEYSGSTLYVNPTGQGFTRYTGSTLYTKS